MRKLTILSIFCIAITGTSAHALEKFKGWDQYAKYMAAFDVLSADCLAINGNDLDYINYRKAASKLLTVMEIDSDLYNESYKSTYANNRSNTREENMKWCEGLRRQIVNETKGMEGDYQLALTVVDAPRRERAETWASALEGIASLAVAFGDGVKSASPQGVPYIPMPSGKVTYGQNSERNYNHYLVNTPSGMRQCHVSRSGYMNCN